MWDLAVGPEIVLLDEVPQAVDGQPVEALVVRVHVGDRRLALLLPLLIERVRVGDEVPQPARGGPAVAFDVGAHGAQLLEDVLAERQRAAFLVLDHEHVDPPAGVRVLGIAVAAEAAVVLDALLDLPHSGAGARPGRGMVPGDDQVLVELLQAAVEVLREAGRGIAQDLDASALAAAAEREGALQLSLGRPVHQKMSLSSRSGWRSGKLATCTDFLAMRVTTCRCFCARLQAGAQRITLGWAAAASVIRHTSVRTEIAFFTEYSWKEKAPQAWIDLRGLNESVTGSGNSTARRRRPRRRTAAGPGCWAAARRSCRTRA